MGLELSQVVAELVEAVGFVGEVEDRQDGMVDFLGGPTADLSAAMQEDFEKADDAQGDPLQKRKVDMDVEPLGLEVDACPGL
jgi:hypothetical protein